MDDITYWQLRYGRQQVKNAVFMQALAEIARRSPEDAKWAQNIVKTADKAAADVKLTDFVKVSLS